MTSDCELLEAAAKAAGIDAQWHTGDDIDHRARHEGMWLKGARSPDNSNYWNPLIDDGDALRLGALLNISFSYTKEHVVAGPVVEHSGQTEAIAEHIGQGINAAVRRVIVRAAAAIEGGV